jgi:hypothetical protein
MKLLVTTSHPSLFEHTDPEHQGLHRNLGRLFQPRHYSSVDLTAHAGIPWAADNDCFQGLNAERYFTMLDRLKGLPGCLFVTIPDVVRCLRCGHTVDGYRDTRACTCAFDRSNPKIVVGDAVATAHRFAAWAPGAERRGLPVALVLQDGIEHPSLRSWLERTWHRLDAVFAGGSTEWKLGPAAAWLVRAALRDGKHVHWGRVNTRPRFRYIASVGGHSFDGSSFARWRHTHLDRGLAWTLEPAPAVGEHAHWQLPLAA